MVPDITESLARFDPISLDDLNGKAAMLERLDNKYVVPAGALLPALGNLARHFDVLEIGGKRAFTYATRYYDDSQLRGYHDHHQGRRKRCKVRIRDYVDAGFSYLEVKLKDRRSVTVKKRLRLASGQQGLDAAGEGFVRDCYGNLYGAEFGSGLGQVIAMEYQRITLVAREGGERMTIDAGLRFQLGGSETPVGEGLFIIETKSARGNGLADRILRDVHMHPTARCSKYCVGMAATGQVTRINRFLPVLRRLGLAPVPQAEGPGMALPFVNRFAAEWRHDAPSPFSLRPATLAPVS